MLEIWCKNLDTAARPIHSSSSRMVGLQKIWSLSPIESFALSISAQGSLEIVRLMFELQPQEKKVSLFCTDIQKMTPLHCAAMFDHPDLVEFLINEGADIDALGELQWNLSILNFDIESKTPNQTRKNVRQFSWQLPELAGEPFLLCCEKVAIQRWKTSTNVIYFIGLSSTGDDARISRKKSKKIQSVAWHRCWMRKITRDVLLWWGNEVSHLSDILQLKIAFHFLMQTNLSIMHHAKVSFKFFITSQIPSAIFYVNFHSTQVTFDPWTT